MAQRGNKICTNIRKISPLYRKDKKAKGREGKNMFVRKKMILKEDTKKNSAREQD